MASDDRTIQARARQCAAGAGLTAAAAAMIGMDTAHAGRQWTCSRPASTLTMRPFSFRRKTSCAPTSPSRSFWSRTGSTAPQRCPHTGRGLCSLGIRDAGRTAIAEPARTSTCDSSSARRVGCSMDLPELLRRDPRPREFAIDTAVNSAAALRSRSAESMPQSAHTVTAWRRSPSS
jgi:hypothetical protein